MVCVYNRAAQIRACLDSLRRQDLPGPWEVVVVDDGSTDETSERVREFQDANPDFAVLVVRQEWNQGLSAARNRGLDAARGEFVAYTDSDCVAEPNWLRELLRGFEPPDVAAVAGTVRDAEPRNLSEAAYTGTTRIDHRGVQGRNLVGNNMAFRRSVLAEYRFDEALVYYCDEDELAWRLQSDGHRFAFVPSATVHHDHPMTLRKYLGLAYRQGQGSARYWYKRGVYLGRDLWPLVLCVLTVPLILLGGWWWTVPVFFLGAHFAAVFFNEVAFKGKSWFQALRVMPVLVLYYPVRLGSVAVTLASILVGRELAIRRSRQAWRKKMTR